MCVCDFPSKEGLDCNNFIADIMVVLPEFYMSSMFEVPPVALIVVEFGLMVADPENVVIAICWQVAY